MKIFNLKKKKSIQRSNNALNSKYNALNSKFTPRVISSLDHNEIMVFGTNALGKYRSECSKVALEQFGAEWGKKEGISGNTYAIPVIDQDLDFIKKHIDDFINFAQNNPNLIFYITRIDKDIRDYDLDKIALLFKDSLEIDNIVLPLSYYKILQGSLLVEPDENYNNLLQHSYGVTRTFADLVIEKNKKNPFNSPYEVMDYLREFLHGYNYERQEITNISLVEFWNILKDGNFFSCGKLDIAKFKETIFNFDSFKVEFERAYEFHIKEKLYNIIVYLNQFREYVNPEEIYDDLKKAGLPYFYNGNTTSFCNPISPWYAGFGRPIEYFFKFIVKNWSQIVTNSYLDPVKLNNLMFREHELSLLNLGLDRVIKEQYQQLDNFTNIFIPKEIGSAPVYIRLEDRGLIKSCGDMNGPLFLENKIAWMILSEDSDYEVIEEFLIPKFDYSLPILNCNTGILQFNDTNSKELFIKNLRDHNHHDKDN